MDQVGEALPQSPLIPAARLAEAWNAMRRGDLKTATPILAHIASASPWMEKDPRVVMAHATAAYLSDKPSDALVMLGPKPSGAAATYLKALCLQALGSRLKAAAAFQEVAERYPDSPLHRPRAARQGQRLPRRARLPQRIRGVRARLRARAGPRS